MPATSLRAHHSLPFGAFYGMMCQRHRTPGFELALLDVDPHRVVERHSHDEAHFVFVLDGLYASSAEGAPPLSRGEALVFNPAGTTHRDRFEPRGRVMDGRFLTLSIERTWMDAAAEEWTVPPEAVAVSGDAAIGVARRLARACDSASVSPLERESLVMTLLEALPGAPSFASRGAPRWLRTVRAQLDDCLGASLSVRDLARSAGVHPVHLARVFRAHLGLTPGAYHRQRRLEHARVLLRETSRPLSEIALACGFTDQPHFARAFRAAFGETAGRYRGRAGRIERGDE